MPENFFYFKIAPKAPLFKTLTYKHPEKLESGLRVKIPLGRSRSVSGLVIEEDSSAGGLKNIKEILDIDKNFPPISSQRLEWLKWMSSYYCYPLGLAADLSFPQKLSSRKIKSSGPMPPVLEEGGGLLKLTADQKNIADKIGRQKGFNVHLIHGVTGSGKTEIYKQLSAEVLKRGGQVLVLLPEIFLTPQIVKRFSRGFAGQTALLHSQIAPREKKAAWTALIKREKNLLIGTRSALFCPLPKLQLVVIDEEHDHSFKQEDKFRYHARDSAVVLAKKLNIPIVLGSATPDFSSYKKALDGGYKLYELKSRALKQKLPEVTVVDLKQEPKTEKPFWLSDRLLEKIEEALKKGRQAALFLNRRGKSSSLICPQCGYVCKCLNCDISLTFHGQGFLLCHYCSYLEKKPDQCPSCKSARWIEKGLGAQAVQEYMEKLFPGVKTLRADRDSISSQEEMENFINIVEKNEAQIIIGTQMLSKGLDFPSIYLVGLILADMDFHFPDFRAGERAFQTILQMSGRAGRADFGEAVLQSFNPEHSAVFFAQRHDYVNFFYEEMKSRKKCFYPPFSRLCLLRIDSLQEERSRLGAAKLAAAAKKEIFKGIKVLGPSPAPLMKIKNRYRFQILIKSENHQMMSVFLAKLQPHIKPLRPVQVKIDRDPLSML